MPFFGTVAAGGTGKRELASPPLPLGFNLVPQRPPQRSPHLSRPRRLEMILVLVSSFSGGSSCCSPSPDERCCARVHSAFAVVLPPFLSCFFFLTTPFCFPSTPSRSSLPGTVFLLRVCSCHSATFSPFFHSFYVRVPPVFCLLWWSPRVDGRTCVRRET